MAFAAQGKLKELQKYFMLFVFVLAMVMRLGYGLAAEHDRPLRADALKYALLGINIAGAGEYTFEESGVTSKLITPGYPFIVAVFAAAFDEFSNAYLAILGLQILLSSLVAIFTYLVCLRFLNNAISCAVAIAVVISPHLIVSSSYFLTETTHSFFLILSIWLLVKAVETETLVIAVIAGLAFGYSALIRPSVLLFPLAMLLLIAWKYRSPVNLKLGACFLFAAYLLWMPWQLWEAESEESNARAVFAMGSYPDMIHESPQLRGHPYDEDPDFERMSEDWEYTREILSRRFLDEPTKYLSWYLIGKPIMLWSSSVIQGQGGPFIYPIISSPYDNAGIHLLTMNVMMAIHIPFLLLALLAVLKGIGELLSKKKSCHLILGIMILFVLYHTGIHMVLAALPRFSIPYYPILFMLAGYGASYVWEEIEKRKNSDLKELEETTA